jgi:uncharacterized protein (DUF1778 family)
MKDERIEFKVSVAQRAEMQKAADAHDLSLSAWLRMVALAAARKESGK